MELGGAAPEQPGSPCVGGACGASPLHLAPRGSRSPSALQCQGHPGPLQAIHKCYQCGRSCTPDSQGAAPPQRPPCFPGAVMSWAGLVRGSCALLLVAGGSRWPGTGPLEPWERAGGLQAGTKRQWRHRGVHVSPRTSVCRDTCVPGLGHMCCTRGAGVPARVHPHPTRSPPPTPALGHFLLRQNCCFFLLVNLTHNLMSGSDFPLPRPGDGLNPPTP